MSRFKDKEQIQRVALIGLLVVAVVIGYARFGRKSRPVTAREPEASVASDLIAVPAFDESILAQWQRPLPEPQPHVAAARDIFRLPHRSGLVGEDGQPTEGARLRLGAVMAGRDGAVARINNAYARVGDRVGNYKVVDIAMDSVVLEAGGESLVLTLVR